MAQLFAVTVPAWQGLQRLALTLGALLFWVKTAVLIRADTTFTYKRNEWIAVSSVPYLRLCDIKASGSLKPFHGIWRQHGSEANKKIHISAEISDLVT